MIQEDLGNSCAVCNPTGKRDVRRDVIEHLVNEAISQHPRIRSSINYLPEDLVNELMSEMILQLFLSILQGKLEKLPVRLCFCTLSMVRYDAIIWRWQLVCAMNLNRYYIRRLATQRIHWDRLANHLTSQRKRFSPDGRIKEELSNFRFARYSLARRVKSKLNSNEWSALKQCLRERKKLDLKKPTIDSRMGYRLIRKITKILQEE